MSPLARYGLIAVPLQVDGEDADRPAGLPADVPVLELQHPARAVAIPNRLT
jgi:hypothetical protein